MSPYHLHTRVTSSTHPAVFISKTKKEREREELNPSHVYSHTLHPDVLYIKRKMHLHKISMQSSTTLTESSIEELNGDIFEGIAMLCTFNML